MSMSVSQVVHEVAEASKTAESGRDGYLSVRNTLGNFVPTPAMLSFRDALLRSLTPHRGISAALRAAGLSDNTFWVWTQRYPAFKNWVLLEWEDYSMTLKMQLLAIGEEKMQTDFKYWAKMVDVLGV